MDGDADKDTDPDRDVYGDVVPNGHFNADHQPYTVRHAHAVHHAYTDSHRHEDENRHGNDYRNRNVQWPRLLPAADPGAAV